MENVLKNKLVTTLLVVLIVFVSLLAINQFWNLGTRAGDGQTATIETTGTGSVFAVPDLAVVRISVQNEASTSEQAQTENTRRSNEVIEFLKSSGILDKDIQTVGYNIYPRYDFISFQREQLSYEAINTLEVKIRDLDSVGQILQGVVSAGANRVDSLNLTVEDEDVLRREARQQAIEQAEEKAKELASDLDVKLVRLVSFNESSSGQMFFPRIAEDFAESAPDVPQIEPGQEEIEVSVVLIYEIR